MDEETKQKFDRLHNAVTTLDARLNLLFSFVSQHAGLSSDQIREYIQTSRQQARKVAAEIKKGKEDEFIKNQFDQITRIEAEDE